MKVVIISVVIVVGILMLARLVGRMPANCDDVAEQLASFELGNYAEPEDRAPVVDRYRAVCKREGVTRDEGTCLDLAKSRYAAARCAPRLFPDIAVAGCEGSACLVARMKQFEAEMCACGPGNKPCADKVNAELTTWAQEAASAQSGQPRAPESPQDIQAMGEIAGRYTECMKKSVMAQ